MAERRQVNRREPIVAETSQGDVEVHPLPWRQRNDLGDFVITSYIKSLNAVVSALSVTEEGQLKQAEGRFEDQHFDWGGALELAFPSEAQEKLNKLQFDELQSLLCISLEINGLENLRNMIDPKTFPNQSPEIDQGLTSDGAKTTSIPDSGLADTQELKLTSLPTPK